MTRDNTKICLVIEATRTEDRWAGIVALPAGEVAQIQFGSQEMPRLTQQIAPNSIALSMQRLDGQPPRIAMKCTGCRAIINAAPAPEIAILRPGDEIGIDQFTGWRLHVAVQNAPQVQLAGASAVGHTCPVCREPFVAEEAVFHCPCGTIFHCQDNVRADAQISCVRGLSECPDCRQPIRLQESFDFAPEGFNAEEFFRGDPNATAIGV